MSNLTVLITGAANGVGRAFAEHCLSSDGRVLATDIDKAGLESLRSNTPHSDRLATFVADLRIEDEVESLAAWAIDKEPGINALVNNAAVYHGKPYQQYSSQEVDQAISLNLSTPLLLSERIAKHIIDERCTGSIVNITSVAGEVGSSDAVYGATKAALIGLTKSNAMNYAPHVRVNAVSPAAIRDTAIFDQIPQYRREEYLRQELLDQPILPEGVAQLISFLVSPESKNLTGKVFPIDNGCYPR